MHEFSSSLLTSTRRARLPAGARPRLGEGRRLGGAFEKRVRLQKQPPPDFLLEGADAAGPGRRLARRGAAAGSRQCAGARIPRERSPHTWLSMTIASARSPRAPQRLRGARRGSTRTQREIAAAGEQLPSPCAETPPRAAFSASPGAASAAVCPPRWCRTRRTCARSTFAILSFLCPDGEAAKRTRRRPAGPPRRARDEARRARVAPPRKYSCAAVFAARRSASTHGPISPWHSRSCAMAERKPPRSPNARGARPQPRQDTARRRTGAGSRRRLLQQRAGRRGGGARRASRRARRRHGARAERRARARARRGLVELHALTPQRALGEMYALAAGFRRIFIFHEFARRGGGERRERAPGLLRAGGRPAPARARSCASASRISSARRSARARASPSGMTAATRPSRDAASVGAGLGDATKHLARRTTAAAARRAPGENRGERDVLGDARTAISACANLRSALSERSNTCAAY